MKVFVLFTIWEVVLQGNDVLFQPAREFKPTMDEVRDLCVM